MGLRFAAFCLLLTVITPLAIAQQAPGAQLRLQSPDGRLTVEVSAPDGAPHYRVLRDGETVVAASRLGLRFVSGANLDEDLAITAHSRARHDETWQQPWGETHTVRDHHRELAVTFAGLDDEARGYTLRVRAFNEGIGFRYEVPDTGPRALIDEITEFTLEPDATSWWTPANEFNRYEYVYETTPLREIARAHTPLTARLEGGTHVAIHEAALVNYGGMWLDQRRAGALEAQIAPRHDGVKVRLDGAFKTPWRTIQIADDAAGLVNGATMVLNLNAPNALGDVSYVEPGKYVGIWWGMHINAYTWGSGPKHGATTQTTKRYIDFAAEHGFSGVLVEGWNVGWDGDWFNNGEVIDFTTPYPDFDLAGLSDYAAQRGVRLIGHHETSGHISNYEEQMDAAFDLYEANGVRAVKTGYVADGGELELRDAAGHTRYSHHDSQEAADHHLRVLKAAHQRAIAINAHEPVKDTGLRRTYPNALTREGARGMEFNAWGSPPNPPEHTAILAYTRLLAGPMDFTPGIFDLMPNGAGDENRVQTTLAKQLALYVVIYSPLQMAADLPKNYEARPDAFQFIKDVPADWEESIALDGAVGDFIVMARRDRASADWYVGGLSDEMARRVDVTLDFLDPDQAYLAEIYRDGAQADWETNPYAITTETRRVTSADTIDLAMASGGGFAIRLAPAAEPEPGQPGD